MTVLGLEVAGSVRRPNNSLDRSPESTLFNLSIAFQVVHDRRARSKSEVSASAGVETNKLRHLGGKRFALHDY